MTKPYVRKTVVFFSTVLKSPLFWLLLFAFTSAGLFAAGMFVMYGLGAALIAGSAYTMLFATIIYKGLGRG